MWIFRDEGDYLENITPIILYRLKSVGRLRDL
jgi:hypothetical protein